MNGVGDEILGFAKGAHAVDMKTGKESWSFDDGLPFPSNTNVSNFPCPSVFGDYLLVWSAGDSVGVFEASTGKFVKAM